MVTVVGEYWYCIILVLVRKKLYRRFTVSLELLLSSLFYVPIRVADSSTKIVACVFVLMLLVKPLRGFITESEPSCPIAVPSTFIQHSSRMVSAVRYVSTCL